MWDLLKGAPSFLIYIPYVSPMRWVVMLAMSVFIAALAWCGGDWLSVGNNLLLALIGILLVIACGIGALGAHIHAVRSRFGTSARIIRYSGPWIFTRPKRWYFGCYTVTEETGNRQAVLTLGADVKEVVPLSIP